VNNADATWQMPFKSLTWTLRADESLERLGNAKGRDYMGGENSTDFRKESGWRDAWIS
jgi:hypothetical protein